MKTQMLQKGKTVLVEATRQVHHPHGIPMTIKVSIEKKAATDTASERVSLNSERQNIYYLRIDDARALRTSTSDPVVSEAEIGGIRKRSAIPNNESTTEKYKQGTQSISSRSTHSTNSEKYQGSDIDSDAEYLVMLEKELDYSGTRRQPQRR
eukprot:scaffold164_cov266-Chaetoceros_neogracile.AAC.22